MIPSTRAPLWLAAFLLPIAMCSTATAEPIRCHAVTNSSVGGSVEVDTDETPAPAGWPMPWPFGKGKAQVRWKPAASGPGAELVVGYPDAALRSMGMPSGGHIRFRISAPQGPDKTQAILRLPDGQSFTLQGNALGYGKDYGSDDETRPVMDVVLDPRDPHWPAIRSALTAGGRLGVKLVRDGKTMTDVVFNFSDLAARDALFLEAWRRVTAVDKQVCTDAPRPVVRLF